jgi:hypothetical protein
MVAQDDTYDLGSSTYRWSDIHIQNLDIASGGRVENTWNMISEVTLDSTATSIEFTGLNGDTDEIYHIIVIGIHDATGLSYFIFNGDSAANYGYQLMSGQSVAASASRGTAENYLFLGNSGRDTTTAKNNLNEILVYAKTGYERLVINNSLNSGGDTSVYQLRIWGQIWNNTSSTITSLKFLPPGNFITNTTIQIWSPSMNITATGTTS